MSLEGTTRIRRFTPVQRIFHLFLMLAFLIQGITGLARMYIETPWGQMLASAAGGYRASLAVHKVVGILMICGFLAHILYLLLKINWRRLPGDLLNADSILPHPRDILHFFQHILWFFRLTRAPRFERWGYWEKFDYWAVFWGIPILGITGLILAYPLIVSRVIPGWVLNPVFWVHRIEALLAMAHVFVIHFFIGHLRPHSFPMDLAMFEGSVDLVKTRGEKPAWIERMEHAGQLGPLSAPEARRGIRVFFYVFGYTMMLIGIFLLIGGAVNGPRITW